MKLKTAHIKAALEIAPKKDVREYLNSVRVELSQDRRNVLYIATDGRAMLITWHALVGQTTEGFDLPITLPRADLAELVKSAGPDEIDLAPAGDGLVTASRGAASRTFKPFEQRYPDWRAVLPLAGDEPCEAEPWVNPMILYRVQRAFNMLDGRPATREHGAPVRYDRPKDANGAILAYEPATENAVAVVMPISQRQIKAFAAPEVPQ